MSKLVKQYAILHVFLPKNESLQNLGVLWKDQKVSSYRKAKHRKNLCKIWWWIIWYLLSLGVLCVYTPVLQYVHMHVMLGTDMGWQ